ncbi:MAG: 3-deoxy-D-manno-octulosonic acid transferase [Acidobacteria bacterium]|nr:3-deoxy-D-manno-octulosonic acid transferase [Acidobacteriota bacterium]
MFAAYTFLYAIGLCALAPRALLHKLTGGRYGIALGERLGRVPRHLLPHRGAIWIHAVSVGEVHAARGLIPHLRASARDVSIVLSTTTPTGQALAEKAGADAVFYMPLDLPRAVSAYVEALRPRALLLVETEIWPNLLRAASDYRTPVAIVNGRLSERTARRYAALDRLWPTPFEFIAAVCARTTEEASRFVEMGIPEGRVVTTGNLKADAAALTPPAELTTRLRDALYLDPETPLIVAGCTMDHEEEKVLLAFRRVQAQHASATLLIAPRHPERFDEVEALVRNAGFSCRRRTNSSDEAADVILLDTIGELPAAYGLGSIAFVGGSLVPTGGHNLLEPAIQSRPVLFGPSTENFADLAGELVRSGGGIRVGDGEGLARELIALLDDETRRTDAGVRAFKVARRDAAAGKRTARLLTRLILGADRDPIGRNHHGS